MSDFNSEGFVPFPDTYHDNQRIGTVAELTTEQLDYKVNEYGAFMQRKDIMPRARNTGERILNHLLFELAYRDGVYDDIRRIEDELCA